jgi:hypothetical protein
MFPEERHVNEISYAEGGSIDTASGIAITGAGPDTQLIAAQPGEIVISKAAVDKFGADTFLRMNLAAGSTNRPKFADNIQLAKQGGMIGKMTPPSTNTQNFNIASPKLSFPTNNSISQQPKRAPKVSLSLPTYNNSMVSQRSRNSQINYGSTSSRINLDNYRQNNVKYGSTNLPNNYNVKYGSTNLPNNYNLIKPNINSNFISNRVNFIKPNLTKERVANNNGSSVQMLRSGQQISSRSRSSNYSAIYNIPSEEQPVVFNVKTHLATQPAPLKAPRPRHQSTVNISELPAIDLRANKTTSNSQAQSEVPDFSAIPRLSDRYGDNGTLEIYGIEL